MAEPSAPWQLQTPVAFIIFNRPDTTERVFAEIARARPPKLLVIADGPRANRTGEAERCAQTRALIQRVDWPCEVLTNFSDTNLGCKVRVASGIDWVFEQVPEAIILEDDCLPNPSFFRFCEELLVRYRDDQRVGMISGDNFVADHLHCDDSYYFSKYAHIWGWATWRRAWKHYDRDARQWPKVRDGNWLRQMTVPAERAYWRVAFEGVRAGHIDTWDYQWVLACWTAGMMAAMPAQNLVSNIGFGQHATHTKRVNRFAEMPSTEMPFPLRHPTIFRCLHEADERTAKIMFRDTLLRKAARLARGWLAR